MRITGYNSAQKLSRKDAKGKSGETFHVGNTHSDEAQSATDAVANANVPTEILGTLLNLQERGDRSPAEMVRWSEKALHLLDKLQYEILNGTVSGTMLEHLGTQLEASFNNSSECSVSAQLIELKSHILLRIRVELAKLGR